MDSSKGFSALGTHPEEMLLLLWKDPDYQTPVLASATTSLTTLDVPQFPHLYIEGIL